MIPEIPTSTLMRPPQTADQSSLRKVAQDLEVTFLSEMLKSAGLDENSGSFGGGAGEDQFTSFMREERAKQLVHSGGTGLAEIVFEALKEAQNDQ